MLQQLLSLLPASPDNARMIVEVATVLAMLGVGLWLMGARYSRQIITLCGVAAGTIIGKELPQYYPTNFSPPILAVSGALVFGVTAYLTHRLWIGLALGAVLASWASFASWALLHGQQSWSQPVWDADMNISRFGSELWTVLPPDVTRILPWAAGSAMVSGIAIAVLWPRLATVLNWSFAGLTLLIGMGLAAVQYSRPQWLSMLPAETSSQLAAIFGLIAFGALVQWKLAPGASRKAAPKPAPAT